MPHIISNNTEFSESAQEIRCAQLPFIYTFKKKKTLGGIFRGEGEGGGGFPRPFSTSVSAQQDLSLYWPCSTKNQSADCFN